MHLCRGQATLLPIQTTNIYIYGGVTQCSEETETDKYQTKRKAQQIHPSYPLSLEGQAKLMALKHSCRS